MVGGNALNHQQALGVIVEVNRNKVELLTRGSKEAEL